MKTTLTGIENKRETEAITNSLWNAGLYSQIIYFQYGRNSHCELALTTSKEEHDMLISSCERMKHPYEVFYLYSHA